MKIQPPNHDLGYQQNANTASTTMKPSMTAGVAAILVLLDFYEKGYYGLSKIEVQKLVIASSDSQLSERVERVAEVIAGFQSPFGMELLASVHWVAKQEGATSAEQALERIQQWNPRKKQLMKSHHIESAWHQLQRLHWI